jgi:hypothetical protein
MFKDGPLGDEMDDLILVWVQYGVFIGSLCFGDQEVFMDDNERVAILSDCTGYCSPRCGDSLVVLQIIFEDRLGISDISSV